MLPQQYQAKHPVTVLAGTYGHPLHPILVTVPIGAWATSLVFDIASHAVHPATFLAQGSLWLIAVGAIGALMAACAGVLDLFALPDQTKARRTALVHASLNLIVTAAYTAGFAWRYKTAHPAPVPAGQITLSAVSFALLAVSGYLGGKLTYRYGVRVADEATQADGYDTRGHPPSPVPSQPDLTRSPGTGRLESLQVMGLVNPRRLSRR
jgi:uncharacterized membrane protein